MSTVVTTDQHLHNLFAHTDRMLEHRATSPPPSETEICKILKVWGYIWYLETFREAAASRTPKVYPSIISISSLIDCILLFYFCEEFATPVQSLCVCVCVCVCARARARGKFVGCEVRGSPQSCVCISWHTDCFLYILFIVLSGTCIPCSC